LEPLLLSFRIVAVVPFVSKLIGCYLFFGRIFRDVPSDITIEVSGGTFALHKVSSCRFILVLLPIHLEEKLNRKCMQRLFSVHL
jgi:hypothetical protein